jgi:hypothetical protein
LIPLFQLSKLSGKVARSEVDVRVDGVGRVDSIPTTGSSVGGGVMGTADTRVDEPDSSTVRRVAGVAGCRADREAATAAVTSSGADKVVECAGESMLSPDLIKRN